MSKMERKKKHGQMTEEKQFACIIVVTILLILLLIYIMFAAENFVFKVISSIDEREMPVPADETENGIGYWVSCDCDRIALDAAEAIESLQRCKS